MVFDQCLFRLSLNDKFVTEFVLIVRRPGKVLGQNFPVVLDELAEPVVAN